MLLDIIGTYGMFRAAIKQLLIEYELQDGCKTGVVISLSINELATVELPMMVLVLSNLSVSEITPTGTQSALAETRLVQSSISVVIEASDAYRRHRDK